MRIKRRELKKLIENYLFEDDEAEEEVEEEPVDDEEVEEEPSDEEAAEEPVEDDESEEDSEPEKETVEKKSIVSNGLKAAEDALEKGLDFQALKIINAQITTTLKDVEIKGGEVSDSIKKLLNLDDKKDDEVLNIDGALNNSGIRRKAKGKEEETLRNKRV